jgi:CubicO group peptidase (beta-lactamase class C family)
MTSLARTLVTLAVLALPLGAQRPVAAPPPNWDAFVSQVLERFQVPGAAVAIVKDGQVVIAKGYGVRALGSPARVDEQTQFGIASNTKIITATALALLVDEGKLQWNAPVTRYLPWFAMHDPWVTRELSVRDLLVHRSGLGLGAGDLLWWPPSTYNRREIAERLRFIKPTTSFRSAYAYDNVLYGVAAEVIEAVSGQSWESFVKTRILDRVGMTNSDVRHNGVERISNLAVTHAEVNDTVRQIPPFVSDNVNPAGGVMSGAADMAKWMIVQLDSGRVGTGPRLYTPNSAINLWRIVTPLGTGTGPAGFEHLGAQFNGYALGMGVRDWRGKKFLSHTGGLPGYVSMVAMIPELKLGVVVLTNTESAAMEPIIYHALDHYLGVQQIPDYLTFFGTGSDNNRAQNRQLLSQAAASRDSTSRPSLALSAYAGTYRDAWYGDIAIAEENGRLVLRFTRTPLLVGNMEHWQHNTWVVRWHDRTLRADAYITFSLNPDGSIAQARMAPTSPAVDFSFNYQDLELVRVRP